MNSDLVQRPDFIWPVRVYWEDTDAGGVVYHARYLYFLERARSEWLRAAGINQRVLHEEKKIALVVHSIHLRFHRPARLDDLLVATVVPVNLRGASFTILQELRHETEDKLMVEARVRIACVDVESFRPCPIPEYLNSLLR